MHKQPIVSHRETYKTAMSNHSKSTLGKGAKGMGVRTKLNQKDKELVMIQQRGVGPRNTNGLFAFGSGAVILKLDGACQSPFIFSSPSSSCPKPNSAKKEEETNTPVSH